MLADPDYRSADWYQHRRDDYGNEVLTQPASERHGARVWFSGLQQAVETAFAALCDNFGLRLPQAHTSWGLLTRAGTKLAVYSIGIQLNRSDSLAISREYH